MVSEGKVPPVSDGPSSGDVGRLKPEADSAGDSFADASRHVADAISFGRAYLMAQADRFKAIARNAILMAVFGIVAAIIAAMGGGFDDRWNCCRRSSFVRSIGDQQNRARRTRSNPDGI